METNKAKHCVSLGDRIELIPRMLLPPQKGAVAVQLRVVWSPLIHHINQLDLSKYILNMNMGVYAVNFSSLVYTSNVWLGTSPRKHCWVCVCLCSEDELGFQVSLITIADRSWKSYLWNWTFWNALWCGFLNYAAAHLQFCCFTLDPWQHGKSPGMWSQPGKWNILHFYWPYLLQTRIYSQS